jgi:PKD repeat protein
MATIDRVATTDSGYKVGNLSLFPIAKDSRDILYKTTNNAETFLVRTFTYTARFLVVDNTSSFPDKGLIKVGEEIIYYNTKTSNTFQDLKRGFAGSRQNQWITGTVVAGSVMAEHHNTIRDALINTETDLGTEENPTTASLNGILKQLEVRFLSPKPIFRATPLKGPPALKVTFQNFSGGATPRFLWDFGDGATSVENAPTHTYFVEGTYTVTLNMMTSLGAQGIITKTDYIEVNANDLPSFFYVTPLVGTTSTAFSFVDQTGGAILRRYWVFDDGQTESQLDPNIHFTSHTYSEAGEYNPSLIIEFQDQSRKRLVLDEPLIVS